MLTQADLIAPHASLKEALARIVGSPDQPTAFRRTIIYLPRKAAKSAVNEMLREMVLKERT